jgi:hypothetical protein
MADGDETTLPGKNMTHEIGDPMWISGRRKRK